MMKFLQPLIYIALLSASVTLALGQGGANCPTISVSGPAGVTVPGNQMQFTADVKPYLPDTMKLVWSISSTEKEWTIQAGQGTLAVTVGPTINKSNVTATLTVHGLPRECSNTASDTAAVIACEFPRPVDEYGASSWNDEQARLDNLAIQMQHQPDSLGTFIFGYPNTVKRSTIEARNKRILDRLKKIHGVSSDRVRFMYQKADEGKTTIYLVPPGAEFPETGLTLDDFRSRISGKR